MKNYSRTENAFRAFRNLEAFRLRKILYKNEQKYAQIQAYFSIVSRRVRKSQEKPRTYFTFKSGDARRVGARLTAKHDPCISRSCCNKVCYKRVVSGGDAA
jgi:hypothetical protein